MVDKITRRSEQIADQQLSGRKVPEYEAEDIRELIEKPYRIIYRIKKIKSTWSPLSTARSCCRIKFNSGTDADSGYTPASR